MLHLRDVRAGGECPFAPRQNDRTDLLIRVETLDRIDDLETHLPVQRIERLRPMDPDPSHATVDLGEDVRVRHCRWLLSARRRTAAR
ncbi:hypothetical protein GCM10010921_31120 [Microbacterium album]|uniref:Uncharacterized protein n=1 Tax=Microbacterium album TaxID=2053191 RepID=A0A917IIS7_9MICO|nr:hypothetical protein GCM10010921_31120 [Microbacterium album]